MKISEMSTTQAADVIVRIADPASAIMQDKKTVEVLEKLATTKATTLIAFIADNLGAVAGVLLKDHRTDVFEIVAALSGKTVEAVEKQKILETIADVKNSFDKDLLDFFKSYAGSTETASVD